MDSEKLIPKVTTGEAKITYHKPTIKYSYGSQSIDSSTEVNNSNPLAPISFKNLPYRLIEKNPQQVQQPVQQSVQQSVQHVGAGKVQKRAKSPNVIKKGFAKDPVTGRSLSPPKMRLNKNYPLHYGVNDCKCICK